MCRENHIRKYHSSNHPRYHPSDHYFPGNFSRPAEFLALPPHRHTRTVDHYIPNLSTFRKQFSRTLPLIAASWLHRRLVVAHPKQCVYIGTDHQNHLPSGRRTICPNESAKTRDSTTYRIFNPSGSVYSFIQEEPRLYFRLPGTNPSTALRAVSSRRAYTRSPSSLKIDSIIPRCRADSETAVAVRNSEAT